MLDVVDLLLVGAITLNDLLGGIDSVILSMEGAGCFLSVGPKF